MQKVNDNEAQNGEAEHCNEPSEQAADESSPDSPAADWHRSLGSPDLEIDPVLLHELIAEDEVLVNVDDDGQGDDDSVVNHTDESNQSDEAGDRQGGDSELAQASDNTQPPETTLEGAPFSDPPSPPSPPGDSPESEHSEEENRSSSVASSRKSFEEEFMEFTSYVDTNVLRDGSFSQPTSPVQGEGGLEPSLSQDNELEATDAELARMVHGVSSSDEG